MSQAERNVATVRRWLTGDAAPSDLGMRPIFTARTGEALAEAIEELWEPLADFYPVRKFPDSAPRHGADAIRAFYDDYAHAWQTWDLELQHTEAVGDDRVLAGAAIHAVSHEGISLEGEIFFSYWLRHGRILRAEDHLTERGARHALGLD